MSQGLPGHRETEVEEEENGSKVGNPPVENKKKTLKQRRKQKEEKRLLEARRALKMEKKKTADIYKLRFIKKEIEKQEGKTKKLQNLREKKREKKLKEAGRLSSTKFQEPDIEFNAKEDIAGNLRNVKKEGSLLAARFKSLQKRNIIEPTVRRNVKKSKIKRFKKPDCKDDWKKYVARS